MPKLLTTPFAASAAIEYRTDIQNTNGADSNSATYDLGFPPETMKKTEDGGKPPKGSDFNGVLYDITDNIIQATKGLFYSFNQNYADAIGGYPLHARLLLDDGDFVRSTVIGNTNNPNLNMTGWVKVNSASQIIDESGKNQQEVNDLKANSSELLPQTQTKDSFKNAYSSTQSNLFDQLRALSACGRCYIWRNPRDIAVNGYAFSLGINMSGFKTIEWRFVKDVDGMIKMDYGYTGAIRSPANFTDATNIVGTVNGSSSNVYFSTIDSSFDLVFTGTGLLINQYVDANGGIFDVYLNGMYIRTMSCNLNNPENASYVSGNIQKLVTSDLPNTQHTVKFVFKGADPLYPPTNSARGWFKNFTGADTHTAAVVTGAEMGLSTIGAKLVANGIIDFAISAKPYGTDLKEDWTPSHGGAVGTIDIHSRKIYFDNNLVDDVLTGITSEKEFKEFTMIQKYTAYNSNDISKQYPLYEGTLVTKFDRNNGLSYSNDFKVLTKMQVSAGYLSMLSGRRTSDLLKFEADNGLFVDLTAPAPSSDQVTQSGVLKSARWLGNNTGLALCVESPEAESSIGKSYGDQTIPSIFNERADGFCKLYYNAFKRNAVVEVGTRFVSNHKVWLATF